MKRSNVSIFVPFEGCPNRCSFCDQHSITGKVSKTTPADVKNAIQIALSSGGIDVSESEIAFFGGSFTAINKDYMISLLEAAKEYVDRFKGIRISTRPDAVNCEILQILNEYKVTSIELGAQSMVDRVLLLNDRGHNSDCVRNASKLIKEYGFSLGLQMMTGLYGSSVDDDLYTAKEFIALKPDTVRIYPTVILENTKLAKLFISKEYLPNSLEQSVDICAQLIPMFENSKISVIRVGLHSSDTMESKILSDGYHPAFRELCESRIFLKEIKNLIITKPVACGNITIYVSPKAISKATGQNKTNLCVLKEMGYNAKIKADPSLSRRSIIIQEG